MSRLRVLGCRVKGFRGWVYVPIQVLGFRGLVEG